MSDDKPYQLLPFRFMRFNGNKRLVINEVGEYTFLSDRDFDKLVSYKLDHKSPVFLVLQRYKRFQ